MNRIIAALLAVALLAAGQYPAEAKMRPNHTATFYGDSFVGRKMARGKRYHHGLMIAAHPRLPIGTRIRVTNVKNGKSVIVTVRDRCACSIDLSKRAFRQIGSIKKGRIPVRVTRL